MKAVSRNKKGRIRRLFLWVTLGISLFYSLQTQEGIKLQQQVAVELTRMWPIYQRYWGPYFSWAAEQKEQFVARLNAAHRIVVGDKTNDRLHFIFKSTTRNSA